MTKRFTKHENIVLQRWLMLLDIWIDDDCFAILVRPEFMEFDEYRYHCVALSTIDDILQCDLHRIPRFDHVEYFIFDIIEIHWFGMMRFDLLLDSLVREKQKERSNQINIMSIAFG